MQALNKGVYGNGSNLCSSTKTRVAASCSVRSAFPRQICCRSIRKQLGLAGSTLINAGSKSRRINASRNHSTKVSASVTVNFQVPNCHLEFGQVLKIVGNTGDWDIRNAVECFWTEGDTWKGTAQYDSATHLEFKFVRLAGDDAQWEECDNRHVDIPDGKGSITITCYWNESGCSNVEFNLEGSDSNVSTPSTEDRLAWIDVPAPFAAAEEAVSTPVVESAPVLEAAAAAPAPVAVVEEKKKTKKKASEPASTPAVEKKKENEITMPAGLPKGFVKNVEKTSDGSLVFEFGDDGVDVAALAAKFAENGSFVDDE